MENNIINELIDLTQEVELCKKLIQDRKQKFEGFCEWLRIKHQINKGFSSPTIYNVIQALLNLKNKGLREEINLDKNKTINKATEFISFTKEYLAHLSDIEFYPRKWFIYFLVTNPYSRPTIGRSYIETLNNEQAKLTTPEEINNDELSLTF